MLHVVVIGSSFGGLTASLELKRKLKDEVHVTVISERREFVYIPSLIWVPFGRRFVQDITFDVGATLEKRGVQFVRDEVTRVVPETNKVETASGHPWSYDFLVIASGAELNWDAVPGLGPEHNSHSIFTPKDAQAAYEDWKKFLKDPGPAVIGAAPGASCMGAGYEYLFNFDHQARKHGIRKKIKLTWVTPEPALGHFGIGGITGGESMLKMFLKMQSIDYRNNAAIVEVKPRAVVLANGEELESCWTMIVPPFKGAGFVRQSAGLGDEKGFIPTNESYQHVKYGNVFAAGLAVRVPNPFGGAVPFGVPKTGYPTDEMAKVASENIRRALAGSREQTVLPFGRIPGVCVMDAGCREVIILTNALFPPRKFAAMIPNLLGDFSKVIIEKFLLFKYRNGLSWLP